MKLHQLLAIVFSMMAAARLLFTEWFIQRETRILDKEYGKQPDNREIAESHQGVAAAIFATAALFCAFF